MSDPMIVSFVIWKHLCWLNVSHLSSRFVVMLYSICIDPNSIPHHQTYYLQIYASILILVFLLNPQMDTLLIRKQYPLLPLLYYFYVVYTKRVAVRFYPLYFFLFFCSFFLNKTASNQVLCPTAVYLNNYQFLYLSIVLLVCMCHLDTR